MSAIDPSRYCSFLRSTCHRSLADPWKHLPLGFIAGNLLLAMGSYAGKKQNLSQLDRQLRESVRQGAPRNILLRLAEEVRLARIRALKARKARLKPMIRKQPNQGVALAAKIALLETLRPEAILEEYSS
jgi:hypothetical protein